MKEKKEVIMYIENHSTKELVAYSSCKDLFFKFYYLHNDKNFIVSVTTYKKFFKKFGDVEEKEIIKYGGGIYLKGDVDYTTAQLENERRQLEETIITLDLLCSKYELAKEEIKKLKSAKKVIKRQLKEIDDEYVYIDTSIIEEFKKQDEFVKGIHEDRIK